MKRTLTFIIFIFCLMVTAITLASCDGIDFKVNFVVGNSVYDTVATNGNEAVKLPNNPTKVGYEFDGWYWDNGEWKNPFTVNSLLHVPLSADMNVYAKFKHNEHAFEKETIVKPTCTSKGYTLMECECGETTKSNYVLASEHTYSEFVVKTEATTYSTGKKERICTACGYVDTAIIPKEEIVIQINPNGNFNFAFDYTLDSIIPSAPSAPEVPSSPVLAEIKTDFNVSEKTITVKGSAIPENYYDDIITTIEKTLVDNNISIENTEDYIIYIEDENGDLIAIPWKS